MITVHFYLCNLSIIETSYFQQALYNKAKNKNEIEMNKTTVTIFFLIYYYVHCTYNYTYNQTSNTKNYYLILIILLYFPWFCTVISLAYSQIRHPQENRSIAMIH